MKKVIFILTFVCISIFLYFWLTPFAVNNIKVSTGMCLAPESQEPLINNTQWVNDNYHISISVYEICSYSLKSYSVQRIGEHLFIRIKYGTDANETTACKCGQLATATIPQLPKKEYKIHVYTWP